MEESSISRNTAWAEKTPSALAPAADSSSAQPSSWIDKKWEEYESWLKNELDDTDDGVLEENLPVTRHLQALHDPRNRVAASPRGNMKMKGGLALHCPGDIGKATLTGAAIENVKTAMSRVATNATTTLNSSLTAQGSSSG